MFRKVAATALANFLSVISHPARIRIVEELKNKELDVSTLQEILEISQSSVSQHLSVLKSHRIIDERRAGKRVYYHLTNLELANWLVQGLDIIGNGNHYDESVSSAIISAKKAWSQD